MSDIEWLRWAAHDAEHLDGWWGIRSNLIEDAAVDIIASGTADQQDELVNLLNAIWYRWRVGVGSRETDLWWAERSARVPTPAPRLRQPVGS